MLYCRRCDASHLFTLQPEKARYWGRCLEINIPESLLDDVNMAWGFKISVQTLLATYSSVIEYGVEELLMPLELLR